MRALFHRFFPVDTYVSSSDAVVGGGGGDGPVRRKSQAERFADSLPEKELSMAQLQGHLLQHKDCPEDAIRSVPALLEDAKPSQLCDDVTVWEHLRRVGLERY